MGFQRAVGRWRLVSYVYYNIAEGREQAEVQVLDVFKHDPEPTSRHSLEDLYDKIEIHAIAVKSKELLANQL